MSDRHGSNSSSSKRGEDRDSKREVRSKRSRSRSRSPDDKSDHSSSSSRSRSRSISPSKDRPSESKHRKREKEDDVDSKRREQERKERKRAEKEEKKRLKKEKKEQKKAQEEELLKKREDWQIEDDDFYAKNSEFKLWLAEKKDIRFDDLKTSEELRELFAKFVKKWNKRELSEKYYKGIPASSLDPSARTKHVWGFAKKLDPMQQARDTVDTNTNRSWNEIAHSAQKKKGPRPEGSSSRSY